MAFIGSLLLDPSMIPKVRHILTTDDFYCGENRILFAAILALSDSFGKPGSYEQTSNWDVVILRDHLQKTGNYRKIGGAAHLAEIINAVPVAYNAPHYAHIIKRHSLLRQIINASTETLHAAWNRQQEPKDIAYRARMQFGKIMEGETNGKPA
jgi:replicative DNA helicase